MKITPISLVNDVGMIRSYTAYNNTIIIAHKGVGCYLFFAITYLSSWTATIEITALNFSKSLESGHEYILSFWGTNLTLFDITSGTNTLIGNVYASDEIKITANDSAMIPVYSLNYSF